MGNCSAGPYLSARRSLRAQSNRKLQVVTSFLSGSDHLQARQDSHGAAWDYPGESIGYTGTLPDRRDRTNFSLPPTILVHQRSWRPDIRRRTHDYTHSQRDASTYQVRFRVVMPALGTILRPLCATPNRPTDSAFAGRKVWQSKSYFTRLGYAWWHHWPRKTLGSGCPSPVSCNCIFVAGPAVLATCTGDSSQTEFPFSILIKVRSQRWIGWKFDRACYWYIIGCGCRPSNSESWSILRILVCRSITF